MVSNAGTSTGPSGARAIATLLLVVAFMAIAAPTGAQEPPIEPAGTEPTEEELAFYEQEIVCPPVPGAVPEFLQVTSFAPYEFVSLRCRYVTETGAEAARFQIDWVKRDVPPELCRRTPGVSRANDQATVVPDPMTFDAVAYVQFQPGTYEDFDALESAAVAVLGLVEPYARPCRQLPQPPVALSCPAITGLEESGFSGPSEDLTYFGAYVARCWYQGDQPWAELSVEWLVENHDTERLDTLCREPERVVGGEGMVKHEGKAVNGRYSIDSSTPVDRGPYEAAARELVAQVAGQALDCGEISTVSVDDLYTPLPAFLAPAFLPEVTEVGPPTGAAAVATPSPSETTLPSDAAEPQPGAATTSTPGDEGSPLWRWVTVAALVLSVFVIAFTLRKASRETRVRPGMDVARIVIKIAAIAGILVFTARTAPLWATAAAVVLGALLGWWQGSHLTIRLSEKGVFAKRSLNAIVAFGAGVVIIQVAGLLRRTGVVAFGLALSFLSVAIAVGLFAGRKPKLDAARAGGAAAAVVLVAAAVLGPAITGAEAQGLQVGPDERTEAMDAAIDAVDWGQVQLAGGIYAGFGKPVAEIAVPRALDEPPAPVTRTVEWQDGEEDNAPTYTVTETFTFDVRGDGYCCSVQYEGTGTQSFPVADGDPRVETVAASGRLADIQSVAVSGPGAGGSRSEGRPGFPFTEIRTFAFGRETCHRVVGESADLEGQLDRYSVDGEERDAPFDFAYVSLAIDCELPGFSIPSVLQLAPPAPPRGDPARTAGGAEVKCPVLQEWVAELEPVKPADGFDTRLAADVTVAPNMPACTYGSQQDPASFGQGGPGGTRHEVAWQLARTPQGDWDPGYDRWFTNAQVLDLRRPTDIPDDRQCAVDAQGAAADPGPDATCELITMHRAGQGEVHIFTDWDRTDGPNTSIWVRMPWGTFTDRCHHCTPGSPEITDFLIAFTGFATVYVNDVLVDGDLPTTEEDLDAIAAEREEQQRADAEATAAVADLFTDEDASEEDRNAALMAVIGLMGLGGIAATVLAESGLTAEEVATAFATGGQDAVEDLYAEHMAERIKGVVLDEHGNPMYPEDDGTYLWDDGQDVRRVSRAELEELVAREKEATAAKEARHAGIVSDMYDEEALQERFKELERISKLDHDALMSEIRAGWETVEDLQRILDQRDELLADLEWAEALQDHADAQSAWNQILADAYGGAVRDVGQLDDVFGDVVRGAWDAASWENARILGETLAESVFDASGILAGGAWGDGAESVVEGVMFGGDAAAAIAGMMVEDPVGTMIMLSPLQDFADAVDPNRTLGERLGSLGIGLLDVGGSVFGAGVVASADEFADAARVAGALEEAGDAQRLADRMLDLSDPAKIADRRVAWELNQAQGKAHVDNFLSTLDEGEAYPGRMKDTVIRIQSNKQSLLEMKTQPLEVREAFNAELRKIYDQTDRHVVDGISELQPGFGKMEVDHTATIVHGDPNVTIYRDTAGNEIHVFQPTNAKSVEPVGADRDFAVLVKAAGESDATYVDYRTTQKLYADGFWEAAGGERTAGRLGMPIGEDLDQAKLDLLKRMDQTITDSVHPEAYTDVDRVIDSEKAHLGLSQSEQVGKAIAYKADEWWSHADEIPNPAVREDWVAEGSRQLVKQFDDQITNRHTALAAQIEKARADGLLPPDYPPLRPLPDRLSEAMDIMRKVRDEGMAPVDMELALARMGTTPGQVGADMGAYLEAMEKMVPEELRSMRFPGSG